MTNFLKSLAFLFTLVFATQMHAQPSGGIWIGSKTKGAKNDPVVTDILKMWNDVNKAYESGDTEKMWAAYTENAAEVAPDGNVTFGKKALREGWDAFLKMADKTPTFSYENPQVRILTNEVALIIWDSSADIQIGGQQVGGKTKGMAVVHKINGQWKVEFDALTPVIQMPALDGAKN